MSQEHPEHRMNRRRRLVVTLGIFVFAASVIIGPYLAAAKASQTSQEVQQVHKILNTDTQILTIVEAVTGAQAQTKSQQQLQVLIGCIHNWIAYYAGHTGALDPNCNRFIGP